MDQFTQVCMLSFLYIWMLVLLPLPILVKRFAPPKRGKAAALRVPFGKRLDQAISKTSLTGKIRQRPLQRMAPSLVWILVVFALARPQWIEDAVEQLVPTRDLLLLVDLSGSMDQEEFTHAAGEKVNRLSAVKEIVGDFLEKREGDRVGLVVFGDSAFLQAPFSEDLTLSRRLLEETAVGMAGPRTALGDAIGLGIHLFDSSEVPAKTIIALTDGNDTGSKVPPVEAAKVAASKGLRIYTIAIGNPLTVGEEALD